ncbi:MAG TPA: amidohydrolase family protein [Kofleriaceae bacterium]|nr:amidohydrolase family protein [Kofleriaceae bacterium]
MSSAYDAIVQRGLYFDGTGAPGRICDLGIRNGRVAIASEAPLDTAGCPTVIDARGQWVMPGFVDCHTHYDAELIASPALSESVRHGVTTVTVGSCSISAVLSEPEDCSDLFTRVEAVPREYVLPLLRERKTWSSPAEYLAFLRAHPLGPNVCTFLGHSDLRVRVMGLARAVDAKARPSQAELAEMERLLDDALDHGFLGLSSMTNPWDKLDGDRFRSAQLPSTYATWKEYRRLNAVLRRRRRILQSAPSLVTKVNALLFMLESAGLAVRRTLKTTLITLADAKSSRGLHHVLGHVTRFVNRVLGGDLRWQTLPVPFEVYADGIDLVVFEEFGAGRAALHLADQVARNALMQQESYRRQFRKDYEKRFTPRVWQRDFHDAFIVGCPDAALVGKSFGEVADARGIHPVDAFLDLVVEHGTKLRWRTVIANDRPDEIANLVAEPAALIGFADSGAHIRNMAFYSFPLRTLRYAVERERAGKPVMPIERLVWRLTGEIGEWLGIDAGHLRVGDRADLVVIDPAALDARLDAYHEAPMQGFGELRRMVNRSDGTVSAVFVHGRLAYDGTQVVPALGRELGFGQFLAAHGTAATADRPAERAA